MHIFYHTYRVIRRELFTTIGICFVSVLVVSSAIISHPTAVAIVFLVLVLVFIHLLGALPVAGVPLNSISMVNLVMAIGLVVDYSMHIAHSFMMQDPRLSRNERTVRAMKEIGLAVSLGIFSTFVAILPLAFATSEVFRVFFKMFVAILLAGGSHGLILMPVVLSLVGPSTIHGAACKTHPAIADEPETPSYADEPEVAATTSLRTV
jgi:multidrug efflux pump subunit AcrB